MVRLIKTVIITDSTCDLDRKSQEQLDVKVVSLTVSFDNMEYKDGFGGALKKLFYKKLRSGRIIPTTSQPSPDEFLSIFKENMEQGNEVIYIGISSNSSGTLQAARIAKELCGYDKIYIVDSMQLSHGMEVLVRMACDMRNKGYSAAEIVGKIEETVPRVRFITYVENLKHLSRGGRLKRYSVYDDGKLNTKTLVSMINGRFTAVGLGRGRQSAFEKIYEFMNKYIPDEKMPVILTHADSCENLQSFEQFLKTKGMSYKYNYSEIGAVIGSHMGPGTVGIAYIEKTV